MTHIKQLKKDIARLSKLKKEAKAKLKNSSEVENNKAV